MSEIRREALAEKYDQLTIDYINDYLSPTAEESQRAESAYDYVTGILGAENCFRVGSAARGTDIRSSSDLDIMHLVDAEKDSDSRTVMKSLAARLESGLAEGSANPRADVKTRAIEVESQLPGDDRQFLIDVIPVLESTEQFENRPLYWVPERADPTAVSAGWHHTDPLYYPARAEKMDALTDGVFRPAVRLLKGWRAGVTKQEDFKLKAFHLELIVGEICIERSVGDVISLVRGFFERLPWHIWHAPLFPDQANPVRFKDGYIAGNKRCSEQMRQKIILKSAEALDLVNEIKAGVCAGQDINRILNRLTGISAN